MARCGDAPAWPAPPRCDHAHALRRRDHDPAAPRRRHGDRRCGLRASRCSLPGVPLCGAKPRLPEAELTALARVDGDRHVLVAYVDGDPEPAGIARLVRDGASAEIAFEVVDEHQGRGIGSVLADELAAVARAAGIRELRATVCGDNAPVVSLLRRLAAPLHVSWRGREREIVLALDR